MTWELICDNCERTIPEGSNFIEGKYPLVFCNEDCEQEYMEKLTHY